MGRGPCWTYTVDGRLRHGKRFWALIRNDGKVIGEVPHREQMVKLKARFESWASQPWR